MNTLRTYLRSYLGIVDPLPATEPVTIAPCGCKEQLTEIKKHLAALTGECVLRVPGFLALTEHQRGIAIEALAKARGVEIPAGTVQ